MNQKNATPPVLEDVKKNLAFFVNVASRSIKILFRYDKNIKLIYSNFSTKHFHDQRFVVLNYRFRNAIWYKIQNKKTFERQFLIEKPPTKMLQLTVYGLFKKKTYLLNFEDHQTMDDAKFCVEVKEEVFSV